MDQRKKTTRVSAAFSFYGDFDYLEKALELVRPFVDQIVLLDGPFTYAEPLLDAMGLLYKKRKDFLNTMIEKYEIKYDFGRFDDERSKRIALYDLCDGEIVFLVDADELLQSFDGAELKHFIGSNYAVAPISTRNYMRDDIQFGDPGNKYVLFKKDIISSVEHINYTWLVGTHQDAPNRDLMYPNPIGEFAHFTLRRSPEGNAVKYAFYTSLWNKNNLSSSEPKIGDLSLPEALVAAKSKKKLRELFSVSRPEMFNVQTGNQILSTHKLESDFGQYDIDSCMRSMMSIADSFSIIPKLPYCIELSLNEDSLKYTGVALSFQSSSILTPIIRILIRTKNNSAWYQMEVVPGRKRGSFHAYHAPNFSLSGLVSIIVELSQGHVENKCIKISSFTLKKPFIVYGNCQSEAISHSLLSSEAFRNNFFWVKTPGRLVHMMSADDLDILHKVLPSVSLAIVQQVSNLYRGATGFGTDVILKKLGKDAQIVLFPNLFFNAYNKEVYVLSDPKFGIMQRPMPIHDVNWAYLACKNYISKKAMVEAIIEYLTADDHPLNLFDPSDVGFSTNELKDRERQLANFAKDKRVLGFIEYSNIVAARMMGEKLHFSDAHPNEQAFAAVANQILNMLGFAEDSAPILLDEKGSLPLPKKNRDFFKISELEDLCYVNNVRVDRSEVVEMYCAEYQKMPNNEIHSRISNHTTKVIITNHKTGTITMERFLRLYCEENNKTFAVYRDDRADICYFNFDFILVLHSQHFSMLSKAFPAMRYRAVHLYRDATSIITSGAYYHSVTNEPWCTAPVYVTDDSEKWGYRQVGNFAKPETQDSRYFSYREIMQSLDIKSRILFEIDKLPTTFDTIRSIKNFLMTYQNDMNIININVGSLSSKDGLRQIFEHLSLNEDSFESAWSAVDSSRENYSHSTPPNEKLIYRAAFDGECKAHLLATHGDDEMSLEVSTKLFG